MGGVTEYNKVQFHMAEHTKLQRREMQSRPTRVVALFEQTLRYVVPIFQRHYVWDETGQWMPLWEDILEKLKPRLRHLKTSPHFLGAVILDDIRKKSTREITRFLVIDGQQRLTTIQLLLAALRDFSSERGIIATDINKLTLYTFS
jgi:uncharacterized protein with ParB-like and HNH nuclease domain